jgi:hypothetical protein
VSISEIFEDVTSFLIRLAGKVCPGSSPFDAHFGASQAFAVDPFHIDLDLAGMKRQASSEKNCTGHDKTVES